MRCRSRIEALDAWNWEQRVETTLAQLHLDGARKIGELSGGMKKRVALAQRAGRRARRAAARRADQPPRPRLHRLARRTARRLQGQRDVHHPRPRLPRRASRPASSSSTAASCAATRATSAPTRRSKAEQLASEALANARADKLLAQEEVWIRKGVEARRTRSVEPHPAPEVLRAQRQERRDSLGQVRLEVDAGAPSGKIVAELKHVTMFGAPGPATKCDDRQGFLRHHPARRQGRPDRPERRRQDDAAEAHPRRAAADLGTRASRHAARGRLLRPDAQRARPRRDARRHHQPGQRLDRDGERQEARDELSRRLPVLAGARDSPVRTLSGGERNRLLLARLFALPANVLVLDEPTNDLDIDTLELLESCCRPTRARCSWSATTGASSTTS